MGHQREQWKSSDRHKRAFIDFSGVPQVTVRQGRDGSLLSLSIWSYLCCVGLFTLTGPNIQDMHMCLNGLSQRTFVLNIVESGRVLNWRNNFWFEHWGNWGRFSHLCVFLMADLFVTVSYRHISQAISSIAPKKNTAHRTHIDLLWQVEQLHFQETAKDSLILTLTILFCFCYLKKKRAVCTVLD